MKQNGFEVIGMDSLEECRNSGYLIMAHKHHGTDKARYIFFEGSESESELDDTIFNVRWTELSFKDILEIYTDNKKGIDSFMGQSFDFEMIDVQDLLAFCQGACQYTSFFGEESYYTTIEDFFLDIRRIIVDRKDN